MTDIADNIPVLTAGLRWLYDTAQTEDAIIQHHGVMLPGQGNRVFRFVPRGTGWPLPVVVVDVAAVEWIDRGPYSPNDPANPLLADELTELCTALAGLGAEVDHTWNGHPGITGSVGLRRPAHPSLLTAVATYCAGCQEHPERSVFCDCGWFATGAARSVLPQVESAATSTT